MLKKESEILRYFAKKPWKRYTFTELKKISKKKSKSYLSLVLKRLANEKILRRELVGNLPVYSLNIISAKTQAMAGFVLEFYGWSKKNIPYNDLQKMMDKIPTEDYVFVITGSYARGKQKPESDIDVVIMIDDAADPKRAYAELSHYCEMNIPPIHLYVFRNREYIEMLSNKESNYGKETARNNLILAGGQIHLKLISKAMQNGFNG